MDSLINLKEVELIGLRGLGNIEQLGSCVNLEKVTLNMLSPDLSDISSLQNLTKLKSCTLRELLGVSNLAPLQFLTNLEELVLNTLSLKLNDIAAIGKLEKLKVCTLVKLVGVKDISILGNLNSLEDLFLGDLPLITDISFLKELRRLIALRLKILKYNLNLQGDAITEFTNRSSQAKEDKNPRKKDCLIM